MVCNLTILSKKWLSEGWIKCWFSYTLHHNEEDDPSSPPPASCYLHHFQIFAKIDSFQKKKKKKINVFRLKKANCIMKELCNLYFIVLLISFYPLLWWIIAKYRTKLKKLSVWTKKSGGTQHRKHTTYTWLFISSCHNVSDILDWTWFLHYFWLQDFIQKQS